MFHLYYSIVCNFNTSLTFDRYLQKKYNRWRNNIKSDENMTVWEADYQLAEQEELQLFWEYQEVGTFVPNLNHN